MHAGRTLAQRAQNTLLLIQLVHCWSPSVSINPHLFPPSFCSHWLPGTTNPEPNRDSPAGTHRRSYFRTVSCPLCSLFLSLTPKPCATIRCLWSQPVFIIDSSRDKFSPSLSFSHYLPHCVSPPPNSLLKIIFVRVGAVTGSHGINGFSDLSGICLALCFPSYFHLLSTLHLIHQETILSKTSFFCN